MNRQVGRPVRRQRLAARRISVVVAAMVGVPASAVADVTTAIIGDGRTQTTINKASNVTTVTTGTVNGANAFNSFKNFNVAGGDIANLQLPTGVSNLVNLIGGGQSTINGIVNAIQNGKIGGNVFFANPDGIVIGAAGVLNVGSLHLSTPTRAFVDGFFTGANGAPLDSSVSAVLSGSLPITPDGLISVAGKINAARDITLRAGTINVDAGAALFSGARFNTPNADFSDVVNTNGLQAATNVVEQQGRIFLTAAKSVTIQGALNAPGDPTHAGGEIRVESAGTIDVNGGASLSAKGNAPGADGSIALVADNTAAGGSSAEASVRVENATLTAGDITVSAKSAAKYDLSAQSQMDVVGGTSVDSSLVDLDVAVGRSRSRADVSLGQGAVLKASGNVALSADSAATTLFKQSDTSIQASKATFGLFYADVDSHAGVKVESGASIAAGKLSATANNQATLDAKVSLASTDDVIAATIAVTRATSDASVELARGATIAATDAVTLQAVNTNSYSTSATAKANDQGTAGIAAALFTADSTATAHTGADLTGNKSVSIEAYDNTDKNQVLASSVAGGASTGQRVVDTGQNAVTYVQQRTAKAGSAGQGAKPDERSGGDGAPFKLAGAVALADVSATATATIDDNTHVSAAGDVVVAATVRDNDRTVQATSAAKASAKGDTGTDVLLSGAVVLGFYEHTADATLGANTTVQAGRFGLRSDVVLPNDFTWAKWEGLDTFTSKADATLGLAEQLNGYASATTKAGSGDVGIAGAVSYFDLVNKSRATVQGGATVTVSGNTRGSWDAQLAAGKATFDAPTHIAAAMDTAGAYAAGNVSLLLNGTGGSGNSASAGAGYGQVNIDNTTQARVASGASLRAADPNAPGDVSVTAQADESLFLVAPSAGQGNGYGLNGTFALANARHATEASIDDQASVQARKLSVAAEDDVVAWTIAGAFNKSESASVGAGIALADVQATTRALIGDNDAAGTAPNLPAGSVTAGDVSVSARTDGRIETIAVAGSVASSSAPPQQGQEPKPGFFGKIKNKLGDAVSAGKQVLGGGGGGTPETKPSFGLAISGSAAVNLVGLDTEARLDGANITLKRSDDDGGRLDVAAVNNTDIGAFSGGAALTRANADSSKASAAIAGAVAVNDLGNDTQAVVANTQVTGAGGVGVSALSGGEQLAIALGVAVNASADQSRAASAAGSVSYSTASNTVRAAIEGGSIAGDDARADLQVVAYDNTLLGTGGGALLGGGRGGIGAAVTYSDIGNTVEAVIDGTQVTKAAQVDVNALTASLIGAGGAMVGVTTAENGGTLGGAFVISDIANTTHAAIRGGASVEGTGVNVLAADSSGVTALDDAIDGGKTQAAASGYDYDGSAAGAGAGSAGSRIIAVAGVVQGGSNNVGASLALSNIHNTFQAEVDNASIDAGAAGKVEVAARSSAEIYGLAVGVGVATGEFAGGGSVTVNTIGNTVSASVADAGSTIRAGSLAVSAKDGSDISSLAGQVSISLGAASFGAAVSHNDIGNTVSASVTDATLQVRDSSTVSAGNDAQIRTIAAAVGGAQNAAISGSAASAHIANTTTATLDGVRADSATGKDQRVKVTATDDSQIRSLAGAAAFSGSVAVGAAGAINRIDNTVAAAIHGGSLAVGNVEVRGQSRADIDTIAVSGAASGDVAVAGSFATNLIDTDTSAVIDGGANVVARRNVGVIAQGDDSVMLGAGSIAVGVGAVGVGASVAVNKIDGSTRAAIAGAGTQVSALAQDAGDKLTVNSGSLNGLATLADGDDLGHFAQSDLAGMRGTTQVSGVAVNAAATHAIESLSANAAGGMYVGAAGTVNVNLIGGSTSATIDQASINQAAGADVAQQLDVRASDHAYANGFVGALAGGIAGVGMASDTNTFERSTLAGIADSQAKARGATTVRAESSQSAGSLAAGAAGGAGAVAGTGALATFASTTDAYVSGGALETGSLDVAAGHASRMSLGAGAVTVGGVAVSGSFGVALDNSVTTARLDAAEVRAGGAVGVAADSSTDLDNWAVSGAGGGFASGAGSAGVVLVSNRTQATVTGSVVKGSSIGTDTAVTGGIREGTIVDGRIVGLTNDGRAVDARLDGSALLLSGTIANGVVTGTLSDGSAFTGEIIGGKLYRGFESTDPNQQAADGVEFGAVRGLVADAPGTARAAGALKVAANEQTTVNNRAGSAAAAGAVGVGAAAVVTRVDNTVSALLDSTVAATSGDVTVQAQAGRDLSATAVSAGIGLTGAGLSGAVAVTLVGQKLDGDVTQELDKGGDGTLSKMDAFAQSDKLGSASMPSASMPSGGGLDAGEVAALNQRAKGTVAGLDDGALKGRTAAVVSGGSQVNAGGNVTVNASEKDRNDMVVGSVAAGSVGIGAAVGVMNIHHNVDASVAGGSSISAGGNISLQAATSRLDAARRAAQVTAVQGSGGIGALGAAVATVNIGNNVNAVLAGGTSASAGGNVSLNAADDTDGYAEAKGLTVGLVAAGASVATASKDGATNARVGEDTDASGATVTTGGGLSIDAGRSGRVASYALAGAGGVVSGSGAGATATDDGTVSAGLHASTVDAGGAVALAATAAPETAARAEGYNGAIYGAVGASVAHALASTQASATVRGGSLAAGSLSLDAATVLNNGARSADATALASGGAGLVGVNATEAKARGEAVTTAAIVDGTTLDIGNGTRVSALGNSSQYAESGGITIGGILAIGANTARAEADSQTTATLQNGVNGQAGHTLAVTANGTDETIAKSTAGSGGLISGAAAVADTSNHSTTTATLGGGTAGSALATSPDDGASSIDVQAAHTARFNGQVDSINAALVGASGALTRHDIDAAVSANIAANANLTTRDLDASAANIARKPYLAGDAYNATAGSGGLLNGSAVVSDSTIRTTTRVNVGDNASVTVTGDRDDPGQTRFAASSDVEARDKTRLDSGGLIDIARAESKVRDLFDTAVNVGNGARIDTVGDAFFTTRVRSDIETSANAKTYGGASAAQGQSESRTDGSLAVNVAAAATIRADGNVNLLAGADADGQVNDVRAVARTDLFNKSVLPIETSPDADAIINVNSRLNIAEGGAVRSVKDVNLLARRGNLFADGKGVGKDLWREAAAAVGSFFSNLFGGGDVSLDINGGSSRTSVFGTVNVAGTAEAGIQNKQYFKIGDNADGSLKVLLQSEGVRFNEIEVDLVADLQGEINKYNKLLAQYANAGDVFLAPLKAERDRLVMALADFGGATTKKVKVVVLDPVYASGGDVNVAGDVFTVGAQGKVNAPGDALISIESDSSRYLRVNKLEIPEGKGGHLTFNSANVATLDDITQRNYAQQSAGSGTVVTGSTAGQKPSISVRQEYSALMSGDPDAKSPSLEVVGDVLNLGGSIELYSKEGSVEVKSVTNRDGSQTGARVLGESVSITAGHDFVMTPNSNIFHVAGDPGASWGDVATSLQDQYWQAALNHALDNSQPDPNGATATSSSGMRSGNGQGIIAGNNVFLNARVLNINGLVQAGLPDWALVLDDSRNGGASVSQQIASFQQQYQASLARGETPDGKYALSVLGGANAKTMEAVFNAKTNEIELQAVRVQGGYMELTGQILNTGGGQLKVVDGYGRIDVRNDTGYTVRVNTLDVGNNIEGQIKITDTARPLVNGRLASTVYRRVGDKVTQETVVGDQVIATQDWNNRTATYTPTAGLRYGWTSGQQQTIERKWLNYTTRGCYGIGGDGCASDDSSKRWYSDPYALPRESVTYDRGGFVEVRTDLENADYAYQFNHYNLTPYNSDRGANVAKVDRYVEDRTGCGGYWCEREIYLYQTREQDFNKHTVKADYGIGITFTGYDQGQVNLNSKGNVVLAGTVNAGNGTATLGSTAGSLGATDRALVTGHDVALSAATGIGMDGAPIQLDVKGGTVSARTITGDIALTERTGDMVVAGIATGKGTVTLNAEGSLLGAGSVPGAQPDVSGSSLNLIARGGTIGTAARALTIATDGTGGTLDADGNDNIWLAQASGDLRINRVVSRGKDVSITLGNGGFIDANDTSARDTRSADQLNALWTDMRLTGAGADQSAADAVKAFVGQRDREYETYWHMRNLHAVGDGNGGVMLVADAYDPATASAELKRLHAQFSAVAGPAGGTVDLTASYQSGFSYAGYVSADERKSVTEGSSWTANQLQYGINRAVYQKTTTDTETQIEQANIEGRNITLSARQGGVGSLKGEVQIDASRPNTQLTQAQREALGGAEADDVSVSPDGMIRVIQRDDLDVAATGNISIEAGKHVYLGSESDINIDAVKAGDIIRIKGGQGIYSTTIDPATPTLQGGSMVLEAGTGSIGTEQRPVTTQIDAGGTLTARGADGVHIAQLTGDLNVAEVFSPGAVSLSALAGNIVDARGAERQRAIQAGALALDASGAIGSGANPLSVTVAGGGTVTAHALQGIFLSSVQSLGLGTIDAGGEVSILADGGDLTLYGDVSGTTLSLGARRSLAFASGSALASQGIFMQAADVTMAAGTTADGGSGRVDVVADGDVVVSSLVSGATGANAISIQTNGQIGAAGTGTNLLARAPGAGATLAAGIVGADASPLRVDVGSLAVKSRGDALLAAAGSLAALDLAAGGHAAITVDGGVDSGTVQAATAALSAGGAVTLQQLATTGRAAIDATGALDLLQGSGGELALRSGAGMTLGQVSATGSLSATAANALQVGQATAGSMALQSGEDMMLAQASATAGLSATAAGALNAAQLRAAQVSLQSGAGMTLGNAVAAGTLSATAGGNLGATTLQAQDLALLAGGDLAMQQASAGGNAQAAAAGAMTFDTLVAGGHAALSAGGGLSAALVQAGSAELQAGADLTVARLSATASARAAAVRDLQVQTVQARDATLSAGNRLQAASVLAGNSVQLAGQQVAASVTGTQGALAMDVTGARGGIADSVVLGVDTPAGAAVDRLWATRGSVAMKSGALDIRRGQVPAQFVFANDTTRVLMDNVSVQPQPYDVQLYAPSTRFALNLAGNTVRTDAFVLLREAAFRTFSPAGENVSMRDAGADLSARANAVPLPVADRNSPPEQLPAPLQLVALAGTPVGLGQLPAVWQGSVAPGATVINRLLLDPRCAPEQTDCRP